MKQHGSFLQISKERWELPPETRQHNNGADISINEAIEPFKKKKCTHFGSFD